MMQIAKLLELPYASTALIRDPTIGFEDNGNLIIAMQFDDDGETKASCLKFIKERACQKRAEAYCTTWHLQSYDAVCEIHDSDWVRELRSASHLPPEYDRWVTRHFMIFIDSFGCIEVVAESVEFIS